MDINKAYKDGEKNAVKAVVASRARHLADKDRHDEKDRIKQLKLLKITKKLSNEKEDYLEKLVKNADASNDKISVDITNDMGHTKSITADFNNTTHMSLHVIRGKNLILDKNRKGRTKSTGYGENKEFIYKITGKDIAKLAKAKYEKEKKSIGLKENISKDNFGLDNKLNYLTNFLTESEKINENANDSEMRAAVKGKYGSTIRGISVDSMSSQQIYNIYNHPSSKKKNSKVKTGLSTREKAIKDGRPLSIRKDGEILYLRDNGEYELDESLISMSDNEFLSKLNTILEKYNFDLNEDTNSEAEQKEIIRDTFRTIKKDEDTKDELGVKSDNIELVNQFNGTTNKQSKIIESYALFESTKIPDGVDPDYGIPEEKKFPLFDKDHVRSAIKFFNYADEKYRSELASKIKSKMIKYNIPTDTVGDQNNLKAYL